MKNPDLTPVERAVIEHQQATPPDQQAAETDRTTTDIRKAQRADVNKITRESLQTEIDLGSRAAKIAADKLDIAQKYADRLDEINAKLKDQTLTPELRKQLEDARTALAGQSSAELSRVGQSNVDATVRREDHRAAAVDGRFTSESIIAANTPEPGVMVAAKDTAENTKVVANAQGEIQRLLAQIAGKPDPVAKASTNTIERSIVERAAQPAIVAPVVQPFAAIRADAPLIQASPRYEQPGTRSADRDVKAVTDPAVLTLLKSTADTSKAAADAAKSTTQGVQDLLQFLRTNANRGGNGLPQVSPLF